jgi:hypothetical protein
MMESPTPSVETEGRWNHYQGFNLGMAARTQGHLNRAEVIAVDVSVGSRPKPGRHDEESWLRPIPGDLLSPVK